MKQFRAIPYVSDHHTLTQGTAAMAFVIWRGSAHIGHKGAFQSIKGLIHRFLKQPNT